METLRILWLNWRDITHPEAGGAETFTHEVAKRLVAKGHYVTLFASRYPGSEMEQKIDGVHVVRQGGRFTVYSEAKRYYEANSGKYDVVIDEVNTRPFMTLKFVNNGEQKIALIHQLAREYWFYETPLPVAFLGYFFLEKRWLAKYRDVKTITVSRSTAHDLSRLGFSNVHVVPEGLSYEPLPCVPEKDADPTIIYLGRMIRAKRPDHVLKAFSIVSRLMPKAQLWMVGDGYYKQKLQRMSKGNVKFFGRLPKDRVSEMLTRAWLLVYPSVREGFGLAILEANAHGTPAIGYNVSGVRDAIIDKQTGLIVQDTKITTLAEAIVSILSDQALRQRLSRDALDFSRGFSWDKTAEEFGRILVTGN